MAKQLKLRRGTTSQHSSFTGAEGEVTVDTDKETLVVHDGSTAGGHPVAAEDMANVSSASIAGRLANDSIATSKIAAGALPSDVTVASANIVDGTIVSGDIAASAVATSNLNNNAVTTAKIAANAVTMGKLDNTAGITLPANIGVQAANMYGNAIATGAIQNSAVTTAKIADSAISGAKMGSGSVGTSQLIDGNVTGAKLGSGSVGTSKIIDSNVTTAKIADNAVTHAKYQDIPTSRLLGRTSSGSGNPETLDASTVRTFLNVENGATADQSASEILTAIKTVDGSGSGLDADTLDGVQAGGFLRADTADTATADITFSGGGGAVTIAAGSDIRGSYGSWTGEASGTNGKIQFHSNNVYLQNVSSFITRNSSGTNTFIVDANGNATATGNVTAYSDAKLKTDIHTINDALGICGKLRGVSYKWIKTDEPSIGVIAQEIEEVIPEVVLTNVNTDPATGETTEVKSVDYGKIVGVLINAINELKAELDEHKKGGN
jgi:hypothetical protein